MSSPERANSYKYYQDRVLDDISLIIPPNAGVGAIYLGNIEAASNQSLHNQCKIGAILSMCPQQIPHTIKQNLLLHHVCFADDLDHYRIDKHFHETYNFIEKARKVTNILIHCMAGISRSVSVLIAYLVKKNQIGVKEAIQLIQSKRWQIYPNNGFLRQLSEFERKIFTTNYHQFHEQEEQHHQTNYLLNYKREYGRSIDALQTKVQECKTDLKGSMLGSTYQKLNQYQKEREELELRFQKLKDRNNINYTINGLYPSTISRYKDQNAMFESTLLNY